MAREQARAQPRDATSPRSHVPAPLPTHLPQAAAGQTIYDRLTQAQLTSLQSTFLYATAGGANFTQRFSSPGAFTLFGPNNASFAALPAAFIDWAINPRPLNRLALTNTLLYHTLGAVVNSSQIPAGGAALTSLCTTCTPQLSAFNVGGAVTIRVNATAPVLATVTQADLLATNG